MGVRALVFILIVTSCPQFLRALPDIRVESFLYNFQLDDAKRLAKQMPTEGHKQFYLAHIEMYRFFATQDSRYSTEIKSNWKEYIKAINELPKEEREILMAELYGKRAIVEFLERNYVLATRFARNSFNQVQAYDKAYPNRPESLKMLGLFNVVLGNVPRRYQWLANLLGFTGDLEKGLDQLEEAGKRSPLLRHEATLMLSTIERNMLDDPHLALERLKKERLKEKSNIVLDYFTASALMRVKKNEEALAILKNRGRFDLEKVQKIPFWDYLLGKACYFKNDYTMAQRHLAVFVKDYKGKLMRTDAYFRLGMSLTLHKRYDLGKPFFELIASEDHGGFDEDEYAQFMAKKFSKEEPNGVTQSLFKARNYFDGGYYPKALAILRQMNYLIPKDAASRTELNYRFARVYHSMGQIPFAEKYYHAAIDSEGAAEYTYLKAYASYFLGEIARAQGRKTLAINNYKHALKYENYFYQSGLENRCKSALSGLK
ncbi:MAG: hypothetical protein MRZ79_01600 [Bacteroidia bacterium]|nr:hypothetical protein [Bacteroidia bacterium]